MNKVKIIISSLICLSVSSTYAQQRTIASDSTIKGTTIEISQIYQPQIKQSVKEEYHPTLPPTSQSTPKFDYEVPQQTLNYSYKPLPLKPLSMDRDSADKGFRHYIKAGLGNLNTILLDAGVGGFKSRYSESSIHIGFLSQKGTLNYQKQSIGVLNTSTSYNKNNLSGQLALDLSHQIFYQYGYDHIAFPTKTADKQSLSGGKINVNLLNKQPNKFGFIGDCSSYLSFYTGSIINQELSIYANLGFTKLINDYWKFRIGVNGVSTNINSPTYSIGNRSASLSIGSEYSKQNLLFKAYLIPTVGQNNNTFLLNDISLNLRLPKYTTALGIGILGSLNQNTYSQLFAVNPYLSLFPSAQTHSNEVYGFVKKGFGHHLTLSARLSWWQYEKFVSFLNMPISNVSNEKMMVNYIPKLNAISALFGLHYQIGNSVTISTQLSIFKYYNINSNARVWQIPSTKLTGDISWAPIKKLNINGYLSFLSGNYALNSLGHEQNLKPILDIGVGAEYLTFKKLALFLSFNNILNNKYQRWLGYEAYGINIYGGIRLKF